MINYNDPNQSWLPNGYDPYKGMSDKERMKAGCLQGVACIVGVIVALIVCALLSGCTTTKYVPVIEHRTDTVRVTQHHRDSIYLSDSIYVSDFVRDDTVYRTVDRWHTRYVERTRTDTLYQSRTDTIPMPYPAIKEVPAELTWWQQTLMHTGGIAIFLLIIFVVWKIYVTLHPRL